MDDLKSPADRNRINLQAPWEIRAFIAANEAQLKTKG